MSKRKSRTWRGLLGPPKSGFASEPRPWAGVFFRQAFGWSLLGLGVAGLALPILPGWLLIGWGVVTLAADVPFFRRLLERVERRAPQVKAAIDRVRRSGSKSSSAGDGTR